MDDKKLKRVARRELVRQVNAELSDATRKQRFERNTQLFALIAGQYDRVKHIINEQRASIIQLPTCSITAVGVDPTRLMVNAEVKGGLPTDVMVELDRLTRLRTEQARNNSYDLGIKEMIIEHLKQPEVSRRFDAFVAGFIEDIKRG